MEGNGLSLLNDYHVDWLAFEHRLVWGSQAKPSNFYAILCDGTPLGNSATMAQIVAQELSGGGYTRKTFTPDATGTLNAGKWGATVLASWTLTAAAQWRSLWIIGNASSTVGNTTGVPICIFANSVAETIVADTPRAFSLLMERGKL
jgi:hypothetical protein